MSAESKSSRDIHWKIKYAEMVTRRAMWVSAAVRMNPHEPGKVTKDLIAAELLTMAGAAKKKRVIIEKVLLGGKLNAEINI